MRDLDNPRSVSRTVVLVALPVLVLAAFVVHLMVGSVHIPPEDVIKAVTHQLPPGHRHAAILVQWRLPRAVVALLAGGGLAVAGLLMQTLFRNPLAGPFVLGINGGATLGVALVVLGSGLLPLWLTPGGALGSMTMVVAAACGSAAVLGLVLVVARRVRSNTTLLILGLLFGYATGALISVLVQFSESRQVHRLMMWSFGTFKGVTSVELAALAVAVLAGIVAARLTAKPLNAMMLGETYARTMGVSVGRVRIWVVAVASVLAGAVTAFCGPVAFLGIAVPHLCRSLLGTGDHRVLVPAVVLMGALLATVADIVAQMPWMDTELPLNAVTALVGTPVVTWVILRRQNLHGAFE